MDGNVYKYMDHLTYVQGGFKTFHKHMDHQTFMQGG